MRFTLFLTPRPAPRCNNACLPSPLHSRQAAVRCATAERHHKLGKSKSVRGYARTTQRSSRGCTTSDPADFSPLSQDRALSASSSLKPGRARATREQKKERAAKQDRGSCMCVSVCRYEGCSVVAAGCPDFQAEARAGSIEKRVSPETAQGIALWPYQVRPELLSGQTSVGCATWKRR